MMVANWNWGQHAMLRFCSGRMYSKHDQAFLCIMCSAHVAEDCGYLATCIACVLSEKVSCIYMLSPAYPCDVVATCAKVCKRISAHAHECILCKQVMAPKDVFISVSQSCRNSLSPIQFFLYSHTEKLKRKGSLLLQCISILWARSFSSAEHMLSRWKGDTDLQPWYWFTAIMSYVLPQ